MNDSHKILIYDRLKRSANEVDCDVRTIPWTDTDGDGDDGMTYRFVVVEKDFQPKYGSDYENYHKMKNLDEVAAYIEAFKYLARNKYA